MLEFMLVEVESDHCHFLVSNVDATDLGCSDTGTRSEAQYGSAKFLTLYVGDTATVKLWRE